MRNRPRFARRDALLAASAVALLIVAPAGGDDVRLGHAIGGVCPDCDFSGRDLAGASVIGNLPRSNFSGAILSDARISGNFASATFARADLTDASLQSANFVNADLSGAKLDGVRIGGANFFGVDLTGATLREAYASWTNFSGSNFLGAELNDAQLESVNVSRAEFTRAELVGAQLAGADLTLARFEDTNLTGANLAGVNATGAVFLGANLTGASLDGATLSGADLSMATGLTAAQLGAACGDETTRLPAGMGIVACTTAAADSGAPADAPGFPVFGAVNPAWARTFAPSAFKPEDAMFADIDSFRRAKQGLEEARWGLGTAYAASHAELDLGMREAILGARDALADVDVVEIVASDADLRAVIAEIDRVAPSVESADVRAALASAGDALRRVLADVPEVRLSMRAALEEGRVGSIDHERARLNGRLDRTLVARQRRIDREIDARLRTLDAECGEGLYGLEVEQASLSERAGAAARDERPEIERASVELSGRHETLATSCASRENEINAERESRMADLTAEIDGDRARIEGELADFAAQMNLRPPQ